MVRDALGRALNTVARLVVPYPEVGLSVVVFHREEPPAVLRAHVHRHFVRELVVNLDGNFADVKRSDFANGAAVERAAFLFGFFFVFFL